MMLAALAAVFLFTGEALCGLNQSRETPVVRAVRETSPAVVNISTLTVVERRGSPFSSLPGDDFFRRFFDDFFEPRPRQRTAQSLGSGVIIDGKNGYILTNQHVILKASKIKVLLASGDEYEAKVLGADPESDLAVLKIDAPEELPAIRMGKSDDLMIGETVIAIGNPFGFSHTVTTGVISAIKRSIRAENRIYQDFIQTDASINPGNSGGPLLNINGELIGINTAIYSRAEGIGFAIPIDRAKRIVEHLIKYGEVHAAWIGLDAQDLTADLAHHFAAPNAKGALVSRIIENGPAQRAGIDRGDVITAINGERVESKKDYDRIFTGFTADDTLNMEFYRGGKKRTAHVTTMTFPPELAEEWFFETTGLRLEERKERARRGTDNPGMVITTVRNGSPASRIGLEPGDILLEINEDSISSRKALKEAIVKHRHKGPASMLVQRGNYGYYLNMDL